MNKEFKNWLIKDNLIEYYQKNPNQQDTIWNDYQIESAFKDFDSWLEWFVNNKETGEKHYPFVANMIREIIQKSEPYQSAQIIQLYPKNFPKWFSESKNEITTRRIKIIKSNIQLIEAMLNEYEYTTEIEKEAFKEVENELLDCFNQWKEELKKLEKDDSRINSPVISLFCFLVHKSGLIEKEETESVKDYCIKVCSKYNLKYTDRVRQNFQSSNSKPNRSKIIKKIYPQLDLETQKSINDYLKE